MSPFGRLWRGLQALALLWRLGGRAGAYWRRAELLAFLLSLLPFRPLRWLGVLLGFLAALRR
ncbi:hypothetical protein YIM1640_03010 [Thermus oshimai]|jgi:hypothetical protein|uniref:hypothetical protein n=1 Tax=Thermus TaxID=270 RepID=UPI0030B12A96